MKSAIYKLKGIELKDVKAADSYAAFDRKVQQVYETYDWDNDYEKEEYEKILLKFRQLFTIGTKAPQGE